MDIVCSLLPLLAFFLWSISLQHEDVQRMNDLGMVSTFPPLLIFALGVLLVSFCLTVQRATIREPLLLLHLVLLVVMLFGVQNLVEEAPRFSVVYRHAGYTDYIMHHGSVNPNLDAYFSWPGFFVLGAFLTQVAGYHDIFPFAGWAPVFYNLLYMAPLYMIFTTLTTNKRLTWIALGLFFITNWIGQDYFSPQGFNFFLYLVIVAMVLRWFQPLRPRKLSPWFERLYGSSALVRTVYDNWLVAPASASADVRPVQWLALLLTLLTIFSFVVFSHPLTPFFVLTGVTLLVVCNRCVPRWLPLLLAIMTGVWMVFMTSTFLEGHSSMVVGQVGQVSSAVVANVTGRVQGDGEHTFIAAMRVVMTGAVWVLALIGVVVRLRQGHRDLACLLLACAPFPLFIAQQYGGEMFLRIYLFSLPFMTFFCASLFSQRITVQRPPRRLTLALLAITLFFFGGFLFTRYGNERMDYVTYNELAGVRQLYAIAPSHSLLLAAWNDTPWQFQDYDKYTSYSLGEVLPDAVAANDVNALVRYIRMQPHSQAYVIITRGQEAQAESFSGLPVGILPQLGRTMEKSGLFTLVYRNPDVQIYLFQG